SGAAILAYGPMIVNALSQEGGAVNVNVSDLWLDAGEDDADVTQVLSVGVTLEQVSGGSIKHVFCQNTVTPAGHHMYRGWGVGAYKSSGLLIERNETTDCWGGIQIRNACSNITVSKNKSYLNHYEGIIVGGGTPVGDSGTATGEGCTDITIDKNTVYDNGQAGSSANIYVEDQATSGDGNPHLRIKITNNVVVRQSSGTAAGIALVRQSGATLTNVYSLVSGNTIKGITGSGIQGVRVLYCPSVEVIGNYVDGCQGANISFNNSPDGLCTENYALNSTGSYGIALTASHRTLVTSNVVSGNNSHGIDVNSSTDVTVNNNTVSAKANAAGIKFEGSSDARPIIKNNTIKCTGTGNSGHGIALAIGAGADYATIQNNTIIMTQDSGTSHTQAGIDTYADYGKISGNKIVATTPASGFKYGIRLQSGADSNWVENNELAGYTAGLLDSGASNIIQNNNGYTTHAGTANTGVTATESSDGHTFKTTLTVSQTDALTFADNAALADGYLLYTFPAGAIIVESAYMSMAVTAAEDTTATPDVGLGTTEGSGANATLQAVGAAAENILTGQSAANCSGTATVKTVADQVLVIEAGDDHTVYFNVAATWADTAGADLTANIAGTVVLVWRFMA
ncbi:MAG: right-handed parallel beta-helix repeat-containing protein, partial [Limnochordia bacterium]|nr:right-handed parallel beta-helix repeat-containing protein [Limnochordia bacterium]